MSLVAHKQSEKSSRTPFLPSTTGAMGGVPAQPVHNWRGAPGWERPPLHPFRPFRVSRQCSPVSDRNSLPPKTFNPFPTDDSIQLVVFLYAWKGLDGTDDISPDGDHSNDDLRREWFFGPNAPSRAMTWFKAMKPYLSWWERQQTAVHPERLQEAI
jgi:hypothetical protein